MKKIFILVSSILLFCASMFADEVAVNNPALPLIEDDNTFYIDLHKYGKITPLSIELTFYASNTNDFTVYSFDNEKFSWIKTSDLHLKGFSDHDKSYFNYKKSYKSKNFALVPVRSVQYNYKASFSGKTIKVEVRSKDDDFTKPVLPKINLENVYIFNIKEYGAEDYVIITNKTNKPELKVIPYYFNNFKWSKSFETALLRGYNDSSKIEIIDDEGIEDIVYMAFIVEPEAEEKYEFHFNEKNDDLYVDIIEINTDITDINQEQNTEYSDIDNINNIPD